MTKLIEIWSWIKLNAIVLVVAFAITATATTFSYFKGRSHGAEACEARYTKRDNAHQKEVIDRLAAINSQNIELGKLYARMNRESDEAAKTEIQTIYREVEKVVEVPVKVEGDCRIDYDGVARVLDGSVRAAFDN